MFALFLLAISVTGQYCSPGPSSTADTNLGPVTLLGDSGTAIQDVTNCPKIISARDLTNLSVDLSPGNTYSLVYSVTVCSSGSVYRSVVGAWIDYNRNGVFETSEQLFPFVTHTSLANGQSQTFVIPSNVTLVGTTRLRVMLQETSNTSIGACDLFTYGATKDYTVNLKSQNLYCKCGPTSDEDTHMGPAIFQGETKDIVQYDNPCPGTLGPKNFTTQLANLRPGGTYPLSLSVITCRKAYPNILTAAWIDWNQNFLFEPQEQILAPTSRFGAIFTDVVVPLDAKAGPTSLRAMVQEMINGGTTVGPCDMFQYGGTQDYPLDILPAVSNMQYREEAEKTHGLHFRETPPHMGMLSREHPPITGKGKCPKKLALERAAELKKQEYGMRSREKRQSTHNHNHDV